MKKSPNQTDRYPAIAALIAATEQHAATLDRLAAGDATEAGASVTQNESARWRGLADAARKERAALTHSKE